MIKPPAGRQKLPGFGWLAFSCRPPGAGCRPNGQLRSSVGSWRESAALEPNQVREVREQEDDQDEDEARPALAESYRVPVVLLLGKEPDSEDSIESGRESSRSSEEQECATEFGGRRLLEESAVTGR
eukprot:1179236-Amphidinium_carterae.1